MSHLLHLLRDTNRRLANGRSLDALAERGGWSKFYLHRELRRFTGETPKRYTQRVRVHRAAAALLSSEKTILRIALEEGFASHEVFVRAFRREFDCAPSEYRKRSAGRASRGARRRHESLVRTVSPCVGLYRVQEHPQVGSACMSEPVVTRVELEEQPVLFIRRRVEQSRLQALFAECFGKLFGYGMQRGLAIAGQPIARYVEIGPGLWTVDCVLPLAAAAEGEGEMESGVLEGGAALKAVHLGPYEALRQSYVAIEAWMEREGVTARGANWEQYVTDPADEPDASKWQTDIYWPIR